MPTGGRADDADAFGVELPFFGAGAVAAVTGESLAAASPDLASQAEHDRIAADASNSWNAFIRSPSP